MCGTQHVSGSYGMRATKRESSSNKNRFTGREGGRETWPKRLGGRSIAPGDREGGEKRDEPKRVYP